MKLRILKYVFAWVALNVALATLWALLGVPAQLAFVLGIMHGGISQTGLMFFYMDREKEPEDNREFVIRLPKTAWHPMPKPHFKTRDTE